MDHNASTSRRSFLRVALATPILGAAAGGYSNAAAQTAPMSAGSGIVSRVELEQKIYDSTAILNGQVLFRLPASGPTLVRWVDSFGRVVNEQQLQPSASGVAPGNFSFALASGLTYQNWIRVWVNGAEQTAGAEFLISPPPKAWDDFHVIEYARYPEGLYDKLREAGVDAEIAPREGSFTFILDNNFNFNVEQMAWEVFAIYHKNQPLWRGLLAQIQFDRNNMKLWVRQPCLNDPKTNEYVRERLTRYVRQHRAFRPLFYNIADELGQGDQVKPNDFCHSPHCTIQFAKYLHKMYGPSFASVYRQRPTGELTRWDDESVENGKGWLDGDLVIDYTTTDRAFDAVAVANLQAKYGSVARLNAACGTDFPVPSGNEDQEAWAPVLAVVRETRSVPEGTARAFEERLGPIDQANALWGSQTSWGAADQPTGFKSWAEVSAFLARYYHELAQVRLTDGWDATRWCDFRNFMDLTFADAIRRARAVCKAEDPHARCSTEGGQSPFAFGWYNYENVVKSIDVIEPYNIGNNVEVIRSLNPEVIMISTHGFEHQPGSPLTERDRMFQKRAIRPIWWGLFHGHRAVFIWDEVYPDYRFVDPETRQLTPSAQTFASTFNELHNGIAKLFINGRRLHDGIAIHYSQASMQVHWLLDNVQFAREWMAHSGGYHNSHFTGLRNAWTKVIEDLGLQYEFVGRGQIEEGKLGAGEYRAFIMPQSLAVSSHEADQIREFVRNGGLLIADYRAASMNEHGKDLGRGQLDDVFGITRVKGQSKAKKATGVADEQSIHLQGKPLNLVVGDERVGVSTGKALAESGNVPLVIVNDFGRGKAVFLNVEISRYPYERLQPGHSTSLPQVIEEVFGLAQIEPQIRVMDASGKRLPGTEIVRFANGACEHVAIFRNPQFDDGGWGDFPTLTAPGWAGVIDNSFLEHQAPVTIAWRGSMQTYDIRGGKNLGQTAKCEAVLDPWSPLVFTRAPQPAPKFALDIPAQIQAGTPFAITLRDQSSLPDGTFRVVRLEFITPDGRPYELYTRNLLLKSTPHTERIPLAYNDPKGGWRLRATDVMTGEAQEAAFTLLNSPQYH
ncbi:MAG: beta-galactosidase trimerization domain-containing protein [Terriglobia bacterium]